MLGPLYTAVSVLLLPGQPLVEPTEPQLSSDTWSLTEIESSGVLGLSPPEHTELGVALLPWTPNSYTARVADVIQQIEPSDTWRLVWSEDPVDLIVIDTWDAWLISWTESTTIQVSQTFAAPDTWSIGWTDVASILAGGVIETSVVDAWSLNLSDAGEVSATLTSSDTWAMAVTDTGGVTVSSESPLATDTWSLQFTLETASASNVADVPIISSDEWSISLQDGGHIRPTTPVQIGARLIRIPIIRRIIRP